MDGIIERVKSYSGKNRREKCSKIKKKREGEGGSRFEASNKIRNPYAPKQKYKFK